jgi:hypothetical protein
LKVTFVDAGAFARVIVVGISAVFAILNNRGIGDMRHDFIRVLEENAPRAQAA